MDSWTAVAQRLQGTHVCTWNNSDNFRNWSWLWPRVDSLQVQKCPWCLSLLEGISDGSFHELYTLYSHSPKQTQTKQWVPGSWESISFCSASCACEVSGALPQNVAALQALSNSWHFLSSHQPIPALLDFNWAHLPLHIPCKGVLHLLPVDKNIQELKIISQLLLFWC